MRPTGDTGVQTHFNTLLRYASSRGVPATCVTPYSAPKALVYPVFGLRRAIDPVSGSLSVWWYRHWHGRLLQLALTRALDTEEPTVVYAQCPVSAAAALEARKSTSQRVVMVVHFNISQADEWAEKKRIDEGGRLYRHIRRFEEHVLPQLDGLVYVSEFMRNALQARVPSVSGVKSAVIPNFVFLADHPEVRPTSGDLVTVGTLEPRKNQAYLLMILREARKLGHRYTLTFIGDGPDREKLERLAHEFDLRDQVRFLGYRPDASRLIGMYRLYCHVATMENFGYAILEAMAAGIPVAAVPVGGSVEVIHDGEEGVFLAADAPREAARQVIGCLEDPADLAALGEAGRRRVEEHFSVDVVGPRLLDFLYGGGSVAQAEDDLDGNH